MRGVGSGSIGRRSMASYQRTLILSMWLLATRAMPRILAKSMEIPTRHGTSLARIASFTRPTKGSTSSAASSARITTPIWEHLKPQYGERETFSSCWALSSFSCAPWASNSCRNSQKMAKLCQLETLSRSLRGI